MNIQGITGGAISYSVQDKTKLNAAKTTASSDKIGEETTSVDDKTNANKLDHFEKTQPNATPAPTYNKKQLTKTQINQLMNDAQTRADSLSKMIQSMVAKQGQKSNLTLFGKQLHVTAQQSAEAAASIAEGGEFSVDSVAGRIVDMAKALSGGDPKKISLLRKAVEDGFSAAGVDFGGKLPDISNSTHDEVMKRFDEWEKESNQTQEAAA